MNSITVIFLAILVIQVFDIAHTRHHRHRHMHDLECSQCPPGHYVSRQCNTSSASGQTQCSACPMNTYKAHNSYKTICDNCSKCGEGLYIWQECTPVRDTVCNSCQTKRLDDRTQDYYRKFLNNTSNESIASIRNRIERNITKIYIYALKRQHNITDQMAANTRKLLSNVNYTNIEVKLWDVIRSEGSDQIHVIYYVERDGALIPYEDLAKTLSYISDDKYSEFIGLSVIEKVKPYNEVKWAESAMNWWSIILSLILAAIVIMCIPLMGCLWWKSRSERRKLIDAFNSQLNRVVPDNQIHWRTVSKPMDPKSTASVSTNDRPKADDNRNEFQYLRFETDVKKKEAKKKSHSKATQIESSLQMQKQKVIPIGELIDDSTDSSGKRGRSPTNEYIKTTFVTTKEIETKTDTNDCIPRLMSVQMSAQTESIVRAIRSELNRIGQSSNAIPFIDDTQPDESIISNTSEA